MIGSISSIVSHPVVRSCSTLYGAYCAYHLWESAIAHLLAVDTCRHGTSPKNYLSIARQGFDPKRGGTLSGGGQAAYHHATTGSDGEWADKDKGYTYLVTDTRTVFDKEAKGRGLYKLWQRKFWYPRRFAFESTAGWLNQTTGIKGVPLTLLTLPLSLLSPTLKVHFRHQGYPSYEHDPSMYSNAIRTKQEVKIEHFGIYGSLKQGVNGTLWKRINMRPFRFALGGLQGAFATYATTRLFGKTFPLPAPLQTLWNMRALRMGMQYGISLSAW